MKRVLILSVVSAFAVTLWADGGVFPTSGWYIEEPSQHAIIEYHGSQEVLHLLIRVDSESSEDFGWIVPLPSVPAIEEDTISVFDEIEEMCRPRYGGYGCVGDVYSLGEDGRGYYYEVDILEEGSVGSLVYKIIRASSADTLFGWLAENGYWTPDSLMAVQVFSDYITRDWVFVVFNVSDVPAGEANVQPVKFTFTSSQIVYPLKITSLNVVEDYYYVYLLLHVITDHRVRVEQAGGYAYVECEYANRLNKSEYKAVQEHYPSVAKICKEEDFITRLHVRLYDPEDFSEDYVLVPADSDDESPHGDGWASALVFPLLPVAFVFGFGFRLRRLFRRKRKH